MRDVLAVWRPLVDGAIEEVLPRETSEAHLAELFGPARYRYDVDAIQRAVVDPVWELLDRGGKRWRPVLFLVLVEGFGEDPHEYLPYATIPELLHTGTILVDDVEDGAEMRRGAPAIHHVYGEDVALNAGNAMYFLPLKLLARGDDVDADARLAAYEMLAEELNRSHLGQGVDIRWHNEPVDATEAEYLEMCACKTGCLARVVARLAAILTDQPADVERRVAAYAETTSVAFQIGDDILDVEHSLGQAGDFGKAFGNDVREGKTTLMVVHALAEADPADAERLRELLAAPDNSEAEILEVIDLLQATGSVEYARQRAFELAAEARERLDGIDLEPDAAEHLAAFTRFVVERDL